MKKTNKNTLGERLKFLRATTTLTQEELAQKLFMTRSCIANYEINKRQPSIDVIERISDYFKVSPDYLIEGKDNEFNEDVLETKKHYLKHLTNDGKLDISELSPYYKITLIEYFMFLKEKNKQN